MRWRFTDKILSFTPWQGIVTIKAGSLEEYGLLERWGRPAEAPAILCLEALVQSGRWLVEASSAFSLTIEPLEITYWRAMQGLRPGERLRVSLRVEERQTAHIRFAAWQERLAPGLTMPPESGPPDAAKPDLAFSARLVPLAERYIPPDRECLWRELTA